MPKNGENTCRIAKFGEDILNHSQTVASEIFSLGMVVFTLN